MSLHDILLKCIILLFREFELGESSNNNSKDLVKKIINLSKLSGSKVLLGGESNTLEDIKNLILAILHNPDHYDRLTLLESLTVILKDKQSLLKAFEKTINAEMTPSTLKRSILSIRSILNNFHTDQEIISVINSACFKVNNGKIDNKNIQEFAGELRIALEAFTLKVNENDPGIVSEVDLHNKEDVSKAMKEVKKLNEAGGKLITGWKRVNKMLNGGFRKGEQWVVTALQHNYKSGFIQSIFTQLATLNVPEMKDPEKIPLLVLFSFEDDIPVIMEFMYRYLYYNEFKELPVLTELSDEQITEYVTSKLGVNGYHIKILRINPSEWTYIHMFNKTMEYEAMGYEIHAVLIDYLSKLPTTGCITSGPAGTDVRDLFNRTRNFYGGKGILNITPHQVSTEGLTLARSGIKGFDFITELSNKNYYSESKQIPQVVDGEIYLSKAFINKQWGLYIGKGKHRTPTITPDEDKQCMLKFPKNAPIPEDLNEVDSVENAISDGFDF